MREMTDKRTLAEKSFMTSVLYAAIIGVAISTILPFLFSALITAMGLPELAILLTSKLSVIVGSFIAGLRFSRRYGSGGLFGGLLTSVVYFVLLYIAGFVAMGGFGSGLNALLTFAIAAVCSIVGGIMGVNMRR